MMSSCFSLSTAQGPAIMLLSRPPISTAPIRMTVSSGLKVLPASLYGSVIFTTSWTPGMISNSRGSSGVLLAPTTPITVRVAPVDRCASYPFWVRAAITFSTWSSVACSFITMTMGVSSLVILSGSSDPRQSSESPGPGRPGVPLPATASPRSVALRVRLQRPAVRPLHVAQDLLFSRRLVDRQPALLLDASQFDGAAGPVVQQAHHLAVDGIDPEAQLLHLIAPATRLTPAQLLESAEAPAGPPARHRVTSGAAHAACGRTLRSDSPGRAKPRSPR